MSVEYHVLPHPRLLPRTVEEVLKYWAQRGIGFALATLVVGVWVALMTWSPTDPSLSVNTAQEARNLLGIPGAFVADFLLQALGLAVIFFLIPPLTLASELAYVGTIRELRKRIFFSALATIAIAGGASALPLIEGWPLEVLGFGGILGDFAYSSVSWLLDPFFVTGAGAVAGLLFFASGFWALSKALCLGRMDLLEIGFKTPLAPCPHSSCPPERRDPRLAGPREGQGTAPQIKPEVAPLNMEASAGTCGAQQTILLDDDAPNDLPPRFLRDQTKRRDSASDGMWPGEAPGYRPPSLTAVDPPRSAPPSADTSTEPPQDKARILEDVLADFRIKGTIRDVRPGPVVTLFELELARRTKPSRVIALADDIARAMGTTSARISEIPGRNTIGIELPNNRREPFGLKELIDGPAWRDIHAKLPLALGKSIAGEPIIADLARMPHLLIAGAPGSGMSVGIDALILSLVSRLGPERCRFLIIGPKMGKLSVYNGIPHLLSPEILDPQEAVKGLAWVVGEMDERRKRMAELGVRTIDAFNKRVVAAKRGGKKLARTVQTGFDPRTSEAVYEERPIEPEPLPYIVIVVDELADLTKVAGNAIEGLVQRLVEEAAGAGIHMIMATRRPSLDGVPGTIKANFPTRISYRVASRIDSRAILGEQGAEQLLGQGDMLFLAGGGDAERVHGPFVSDEDVEQITSQLRKAYPKSHFTDESRFPIWENQRLRNPSPAWA